MWAYLILSRLEEAFGALYQIFDTIFLKFLNFEEIVINRFFCK